MGGEPRLTPVELLVLRDIRCDRTNYEIAGRLDRTVDTVRYHIKRLCEKLGCRTKVGLAAWAARHPDLLAERLPNQTKAFGVYYYHHAANRTTLVAEFDTAEAAGDHVAYEYRPRLDPGGEDRVEVAALTGVVRLAYAVLPPVMAAVPASLP